MPIPTYEQAVEMLKHAFNLHRDLTGQLPTIMRAEMDIFSSYKLGVPTLEAYRAEEKEHDGHLMFRSAKLYGDPKAVGVECEHEPEGKD